MPSVGSGSRVPPGGTSGSFLQKKSTVDYDYQWATSTTVVPTGGTTGQVLMKNSGSNYDMGWATPTANGSGNPTVFYSPTQPTAMAVGDIWINTSGAY